MKPNLPYFDMPKSAAFIQIKAGVIEITANIPVSLVTTYLAIGEHLNVMPCHVAYILTTLSLEEKLELPWYRVVAEKGAISLGKLTDDIMPKLNISKQKEFNLRLKIMW
jgi:methylated-DNA-protein-cysteine methyltransferase related protein